MKINNKRVIAVSNLQSIADYMQMIQLKVDEADSVKVKINILFDAAKDLFWACRNSSFSVASLRYYLMALNFLDQSKPYQSLTALDLLLETKMKVLVMLNKKAAAHLATFFE